MKKKQKDIEADAKTPDTFLTLSEVVLRWLEGHVRTVAAVLVLAMVAGLGWLGHDLWSQSRERRAAAEIYEVEGQLNHIREKIAKEEDERREKIAKEAKAKAKAQMKSDEPAPVDFDKTYGVVAPQLETAILAQSHSQAALVSAMSLVDLYLDSKKPALADAFLKKFSPPESSDPLAVMLRLQRATVAMEQKDFERAARELKSLSEKSSANFLKAEALLKLGVALEAMGHLDEALQTFSRVSTDFGGSEAAKTAKGYIRLLELQRRDKPEPTAKG